MNSDIEWIGEIPKHWKIDRLKDISEINYAVLGSDTPNDFILKYIDISNVDVTGIVSETAIEELEFELAPSRARRIIKKGDVIISSVRPNLQAIAFINLEDENLICSTGFNVVKISDNVISSKFLYYYLLSDYSKNYFEAAAKGVGYPAVADKDFNILKVLVPRLDEQIAIAKYLDKACADIDRVVEIKRKQIENLQQQLKAQMSNWFAIGTDNNLKKTDSVIIPEIPEHWQLLKLKRVLEEKLKYGANESGDLDNPDDPRYIRITDFDDDGSLRDDTFKSLPLEVANDYLLNEGDILFARSGATVGKTFIFKNYEGVACYAGYLIKAVTLKYKMLPEYLYYYTKTKMYEDWKNLIFTQATIQNIGADKYQYLPVPVPPIEEQREILKKTDLLNENVKKAQSKIEKQIEVLLTYKKSLIHEVVTGKKQVYSLTQEKKQMQTA
ncbi:restriction endonuclease subunit S [Leptospira levettii]|uniref:restriction endonuclease subunit S n=1 Tax=Leptospira levettii TaxID=2023178 RepID=UPI00143831E0|nr:restriction endonuclease subunit S [Leptospira levettii]